MSIERNELLTCCNIDKPHKDYDNLKEAEDHILHTFIDLKCPQEWINDCLQYGLRRALSANGHEETFGENKNILKLDLVMDV